MMCTSAWLANQMRMSIRWQRRTTTPTIKMEFQKCYPGKEMLAPPMGSQPLPRWARGTLSVPYRPGTPTYRLRPDKGQGMCPCATMCPAAPKLTSLLREGSGIAMCPKALNPASPSRKPPALSLVLRLRNPPHHPGGLRCCHVSLCTGPYLSA
jgi:hypothetical protein